LAFKKHDTKNLQGPDRLSPYPTSRLSAPISLVDSARVIEQASEVIAGRTNAQLETIVEQIRFLEQQARGILNKAQSDMDLHQAECRFQKVPGKHYHLYERPDGRRYFSMLAPEEYTRGAPHPYLGAYRFEGDQSFTATADVDARERQRQEAEALLLGRRLKERG
jgi:hypothetical protein